MPILLIAIFVGIFVYRAANQAAQKNAPSSSEKTARPENPAQPGAVHRPGAEGYAPASRPPMVKQPARPQEHTPIRPTVRETIKNEPGSMTFSSNEGLGSAEGTASTEGECIEENPQHCAVEHLPDAVYDEDTGFSTEFDRRELLRAMIMGEVLNAPKWKTN